MKKEILKRLLSGLLALIIIVGLIPATPVSAAEEKDYYDVYVHNYDLLRVGLEHKDNQRVILTSDIFVEAPILDEDEMGILKVYDPSVDDDRSIVIYGNKILELNGFKIFYKDSTNARIYDDSAPDEYRSDLFNRWFTTMIHVPDNAELIVNDTSKGAGAIMYYGYMIGCDPSDFYNIYTHRDIFKVDGTLIINNGQFQAGEIKYQGGVEYEENIETGDIMPSLFGSKLWTCTWGTVVNARAGAKVVINGGTLVGHGSSNESRDAVIEGGDNADILINYGKFYARGGANVFSVTDLTHLQVRKASFDTHACPFDEDTPEEDTRPGGEFYNREWRIRCLDHPESGNERFYKTKGGKLAAPKSILFNEYTNEWLTPYMCASIDRTWYYGDEIPSINSDDYREIFVGPDHRTDDGLINVTQRSDQQTYIHNKEPMASVAWSTQDYELKLAFNPPTHYSETDLIDGHVKIFTWKVWDISESYDILHRAADYSYWDFNAATMDMEALAVAAGFDWNDSDSWQVRCDVEEGTPNIGYFTVQSNPIDIAIVEENPYQVQYTANGGRYTNDDGIHVVNFEENGRVDASLAEVRVKLSDKVPVREGYKFESYAVQHYGKGQLPGTYQPGDYVTITSGYPTYENRIVVIANWSRIPLRECEKVTVEYPTYFEVGEEITLTAIPTPAEPTEGQYHYTWEVWYPDTDETEIIQGTTSPELKYTFEDERPRVFYVYVNNYFDGNLSEGRAYSNTSQLYPCAELQPALYVNDQLITENNTTVHVKLGSVGKVEVQTTGGRKPYQYFAMARYGSATEFGTLTREVNTEATSHYFLFDPGTFSTAAFKYVVTDERTTVSSYTVNIESHAPISFHSCREAETVINKPTEVNLWMQVNGYDVSGKCYELINGSWVEREDVTAENALCPVYVDTPGTHQFKVVLTDYFGDSISREFTIIYDNSVPQEMAADGSGSLAFRDCYGSGEHGTVFPYNTDIAVDVLAEFDYDPASSMYTDVRNSVKQNTGLEIEPVADWVTVDLSLQRYASYAAYVADKNDYVDVYAEFGDTNVDDLMFDTEDGIPDSIDRLGRLSPGYYVMKIEILNRSNDPYWQNGGLGSTNNFTVTGNFEILESGAEHIHNYNYNVETVNASEHVETCYCGVTRQVAHCFNYPAFDQRWEEMAIPVDETFTLYSGVEYRQCSCSYGEYRWAYVDTFTLDQEEIALKPNAQTALVPTVTFQGVDPEWESMLGGFTEEEITQFATPNTAVIWTSSNEDVVTVDESGMITAVNQGTAVITATTVQKAGKNQESAVATCTVTVGCPHDNILGMAEQVATCMSAGWKTYYFCEDCDAVSLDGTFEDNVTYEADVKTKKLPHMMSSAWSFDEENHFHVCTYGCGTALQSQAHIPNVEAASCEQNQICTVCSAELAPKTGHAHASYGSNESEHWSICICGEILTESNAVHIYGEDDTCDFCGYTKPALGYEPVATANVIIEAPVYGGKPSFTVTCDAEGYTASVIGWIHADQIGGSTPVDATHTILCGSYILQLRFAPKSGYGFNEDTVFTVNGQPTVILDGDYGRQCIFELPHVSGISYEEQLPTCTAEGHNAYSYCADCDTYTLDGTYNDHVNYEHDVKLDMLSHEPAEDWTADGDGHYHTCTYGCGTKLDQAEHTAAEAVQENVVGAGCTTGGSHDNVVYCSVCEYEISRETITVEALGHNYEDGFCTRCGAEENVEGPQITQQPADYVGVVGDTATFTVVAEGEGLKYQWYYYDTAASEWKKSTGATSATQSVEFKAYRNNQEYRCEITDSDGNTVTTNIVKIVAKEIPLVITVHPVDYFGAVNDNVTMTVEATGNGLTYQWYYSDDAGATWKVSGSPGFATATLQPILRAYRDGYRFYCVVTDIFGNTAQSNVASMTVKASDVIITQQPDDVTNGVLDQLYSFKVTATGDNLEYRWEFSSDGGETWQLSWNQGYNADTLTVRLYASRSGYLYRCKITSGLKTVVYTDPVELKLQAPSATIVKQPTNVAVISGKTIKFQVEATGTNLTYKWYRSNDKGVTWIETFLSGYNTNTLSFEAYTNRAALYKCKITDGSGKVVWTDNVKLRILSAELKILSQPENVVCANGTTATFKVEAQGDTLKYQWYASSDGGATWTVSYLTGYNTDTFSFTVNATRASKLYKCVITDAGGNTVETDAVSVTIG